MDSSEEVEELDDDFHGEDYLFCPRCTKFFLKDKCILHTTKKGTMTYPICPNCKDKHPMRTKPHCKRWWNKKIEPKRI